MLRCTWGAVEFTLGLICRGKAKRSLRQRKSRRLLPGMTRSFASVASNQPNWRAETQMESFSRVLSTVSSGIGAFSIWHCLSAANSSVVRFAALHFLVAVLLSVHSMNVSSWQTTLVACVAHLKLISMAALQRIAWGSLSCFGVKSPNMALNLAPFGRWTLRNKAAQRRLALR